MPNYANVPNLADKCDFCSHIAAHHFATFDGKRTGCIEDMGQRDGPCSCRGFAFIYRPSFQVYMRSSRGNEEMQEQLDSTGDQPGGGRVAQQWDR